MLKAANGKVNGSRNVKRGERNVWTVRTKNRNKPRHRPLKNHPLRLRKTLCPKIKVVTANKMKIYHSDVTMAKDVLQSLCREYLSRLRYMAEKHGLLPWVNETIKANRRRECEATKKEVEMLSRLCNDERVTRTDVPKMLGKSYRQSVDDDDFSRIRHLPRLGTYLKLDALLLKNEQRKKK